MVLSCLVNVNADRHGVTGAGGAVAVGVWVSALTGSARWAVLGLVTGAGSGHGVTVLVVPW